MGVTVAVLALALALAGPLAGASAAGGHEARAAVGRAPAGPAGARLVLERRADVKAVDIATDAGGTAYIGWISSDLTAANRRVRLCVLPTGARSCQGGILSTASLGGSSAAGLRVLLPPGGPVTLIWFHDTDDSISGPLGAKVATATYASGTLGPAQDVAAAPSFGSLATAAVGPGGAIWAVTQQSAGAGNNLRVVPGLGNPAVTLRPPWLTNRVALGFSRGRAVLVTDRYGSISEPLRVVRQTSGGWSGFARVPRTWTVGGAFDLGQARSGLRLVASVPDARYFPQVARWNGTAFGRFILTGDRNNCAPSSHDLHPDSSGRLADTSFECSRITVVNQPKATKAAIARFASGGTPVGTPQIGASSRGLGWVAWMVTARAGGMLLRAVPVRLPALSTAKAGSSRGGRVTLVGPVSCLPAVDTHVAVSGRPASGWRLVGRTLLRDGARQGATLRGAALAPGSNHVLTGQAAFAKGSQRVRASVRLPFRSCA